MPNRCPIPKFPTLTLILHPPFRTALKPTGDVAKSLTLKLEILHLSLKMTTPEDGSNISFDPNGDRCLIVGTGDNQKRFRVSSNAMCLASPVWKAMFTGGWKETTTEEISFPEADPNALSIALRIAHLQFKDLPSSVNFKELLRLAGICDEYDLVKIVRPFLAKWIERFERLALKNEYPEEWLLVAWTFGNRDVFGSITRRILLYARTNADGQCLNEKNKILEDFMPSDIIGWFRVLSLFANHLPALTRLKQTAYFVHETLSSLKLSMSATNISTDSSQTRHDVAKPIRTWCSVIL